MLAANHQAILESFFVVWNKRPLFEQSLLQSLSLIFSSDHLDLFLEPFSDF
jgi:hypothetical protein